MAPPSKANTRSKVTSLSTAKNGISKAADKDPVKKKPRSRKASGKGDPLGDEPLSGEDRGAEESGDDAGDVDNLEGVAGVWNGKM